MNRNHILISLPILALLACGVNKKKEKSLSEPTSPSPEVVSTASNVTTDSEVPELGTPSAVNQTPNAESKGKDTVPVSVPTTNTGSGKGEAEPNPPSKDDSGKDNPTQSDCEIHTLTFDSFASGEKIKEQYRTFGVRFEAWRRTKTGDMPQGEAIIFDSAARPDSATRAEYLKRSVEAGNDNGFDDDLTTDTQKNILIIAEHLFDVNPQDAIDRVTYPDDNTHGGKIKLYFDKPTRVLDLDFISTETDSSKLELWSGPTFEQLTLTHSQNIPKLARNQVQKNTVTSNGYVNKLKIILGGGGAVDNIRICVKK